MIIWNSLKLFPHIHGYLFSFANTETYVIYSIKLIEKLSRRHLVNSSDVFVIKGFTVFRGFVSFWFRTCIERCLFITVTKVTKVTKCYSVSGNSTYLCTAVKIGDTVKNIYG